MTCEPSFLTSKVSVPAGTSTCETSHPSSVEVTDTVRASPESASSPRVFSVHAARKGTATSKVTGRAAATVLRIRILQLTGVGLVVGAGAGLLRRRAERRKSVITGTT